MRWVVSPYLIRLHDFSLLGVFLSHSLFLFLQIEARGGKCIPVQCDHANDEQVKQLFEQISKEQNGRLDVLVNNAYSAVTVSAIVVYHFAHFCPHKKVVPVRGFG